MSQTLSLFFGSGLSLGLFPVGVGVGIIRLPDLTFSMLSNTLLPLAGVTAFWDASWNHMTNHDFLMKMKHGRGDLD